MYNEEIITFPFENKKTPINIQIMGITHPNPTYKIDVKNLKVYVFEYIISGKGTLINNCVEYSPEAGDVYILKEGAESRYYSDKQEPWEKIWINVYDDRGYIGNLLRIYGIKDKTLFKKSDASDLFEKIYRLCKSKESYEVICYRTAIILNEIISMLAMNIEVVDSKAEMAINIKKILDESIEEKITLEDISERVHISSSQVIRIFKREFKQTPYSYLIDRRLDVAKILLESSNMSISQIADKLKFADEHYFSTFFKEKVKVSPRSYRYNKL